MKKHIHLYNVAYFADDNKKYPIYSQCKEDNAYCRCGKEKPEEVKKKKVKRIILGQGRVIKHAQTCCIRDNSAMLSLPLR